MYMQVSESCFSLTRVWKFIYPKQLCQGQHKNTTWKILYEFTKHKNQQWIINDFITWIRHDAS